MDASGGTNRADRCIHLQKKGVYFRVEYHHRPAPPTTIKPARRPSSRLSQELVCVASPATIAGKVGDASGLGVAFSSMAIAVPGVWLRPAPGVSLSVGGVPVSSIEKLDVSAIAVSVS